VAVAAVDLLEVPNFNWILPGLTTAGGVGLNFLFFSSCSLFVEFICCCCLLLLSIPSSIFESGLLFLLLFTVLAQNKK
jgi:hypothetical protein